MVYMNSMLARHFEIESILFHITFMNTKDVIK